MNKPGLDVYSIHQGSLPNDCPPFIVCRDVVMAGYAKRTHAWAADSLEQARALIPQDLVCFERHPDDDPTVLETWL